MTSNLLTDYIRMTPAIVPIPMLLYLHQVIFQLATNIEFTPHLSSVKDKKLSDVSA